MLLIFAQIRINKINNMLNQISNEDLYLKLNGLNNFKNINEEEASSNGFA